MIVLTEVRMIRKLRSGQYRRYSRKINPKTQPRDIRDAR